MIMWTLYTNNLWPCGLFDLTEQVYIGTGKLKITSVLQRSHYKSPFLHAHFLSLSFCLSSFNCSFLHMHGEVGWTFLLLFLCGWKKGKKPAFLNKLHEHTPLSKCSSSLQWEKNIEKTLWNSEISCNWETSASLTQILIYNKSWYQPFDSWLLRESFP